MSRSRNFCFTLNNFSEEEEKLVKDLPARYLIFGREVGENGTPHLQGFVVFKHARSLQAVKNLVERWHIEVAHGSVEQNVVYCSKGGVVFESGEKPVSNTAKGASEKRRWEDAVADAKAGNLDSVPADIYLRFYGSLKRIQKDHPAPLDDCSGVTGVWFHGVAGAGKSRLARERYPGAYFKMCNKWWDGYLGEDNIIMDDLDPNHKCLAHHLKIWSDRYAFLAEVKGGAILIRPKVFCVTSQYSPEEIFEDDVTIAAIRRRFEVVHVDSSFFASHGNQ
jgi:hypothetical protein